MRAASQTCEARLPEAVKGQGQEAEGGEGEGGRGSGGSVGVLRGTVATDLEQQGPIISSGAGHEPVPVARISPPTYH